MAICISSSPYIPILIPTISLPTSRCVIFQEAYSDDSICVMTKAYEGRELLLVFNPTAESVSVSLKGLSVQGKPVSELTILGQLLTGEEPVTVDGNDVTMPTFSVLVMGVE